MDISSIMISFRHNSLLRRVFNKSEDKLGISPRNSITGKPNAECSVIPWMLCVALPVGAASNTLMASGFVLGNELKYLTKPSYRPLITVLLPTPAPPPI